MNKRTKKLIITILKFGLTAFALYFVFQKIEFTNVLAIYKQSNVAYLILALLFFAASKVLSAFRLQFFLKQTGVFISQWVNIKLYALGMFYNLFLPGGISGDGYKIYLLQKNYKTGTGKLFGAVLTDRISGMSALTILALIIFSFHTVPVQGHTFGFLLVPMVLLVLYFFMRWFYSYFLQVYSVTLFFSLGVQLLQLMCTWMIVLALGETQQVWSYLLVFLVSSIIAILPISIGGMGVRELTFLYGAKILGINADLAVSVSLMFYIITAVISFIGIVYVIRPIQLKIR
ncbi:MAG: flippase-like domain-containing protein [Bacteroidetes bacterium]|nr:flippase-like domain-containing protein [Bacteroidota bacterium]